MIKADTYEAYLKNLLDGNRAPCAAVVGQLLAVDTPIETIYTDLFQKSLYRVGKLWEHNRISVAEEHLATAITESLLSLVYPVVFTSPRKGRRAIVACVANEYHQLGGKMVADVFEMQGWDAYFLGANTPVNDLLELIDDKVPDILGLSLAIYFNISGLTRTIKEVRHYFSDLPMVVGGQAFAWGGGKSYDLEHDVTQVDDLKQLELLIEQRFNG